TDLAVLERWCVAYHIWRNAVIAIMRDGTRLTGATGGPIKNPDLTTKKEQESEMDRTGAMLGLDPSSRQRLIGMAGQKKQDNGSAIYTIKTGINWNGQYYDAKFLMGATVQNGKVVTQIGFSADTFGIFNPSSGKLEPVFFVENGQVFINDA
uniref:phage terminase small subunit P27 family n=1 Tax=Providencia rettgeri TaxID=587 RepID=UPI001BD14F2E